MTGKLQNRACFNFFLTLVRPAFDIGHQFFQCDLKRLAAGWTDRKQECEYREKWRNLQPSFVVALRRFHTKSNKVGVMFSSLRKRWKVGKKEFTLILCVFAITGFATAWLSRSVTGWVGFTSETHWSAKLLVRLAVLLFGYQAILLTVAFLLGQFSFFWKFEKRVLQRIGLMKATDASSTKS